MQLSIRARTIEVTDQLRDLVNRRLQMALDPFKDRAEAVSVYLQDLNGPRRGVDKICQITVRIRGVGEVSVLEKGETEARALNRAANRLKYRVSEGIRRAAEPSTDSIRTIPAEA